MLDLIAQLETVRSEKLDPVVLERVVRGRYHDTQVRAQAACQHSHRRRRHRPDQDHVHPHGNETASERRLEHVARNPGILGDNYTVSVIAACKVSRGGGTDLERRFCGHRHGIGGPANAIGPEEFSGAVIQ